jgi:hypothetical protein
MGDHRRTSFGVSGRGRSRGSVAILGVVLLMIILFLPGGIVEGLKRLARLVTTRGGPPSDVEDEAADTEPAATQPTGRTS